MTLIMISDKAMTAPIPGAKLLRGDPHYRNSFSVSNRENIVGTTTDAGAGLTVAPWEGTPNEMAISSGELVRSTLASGASFGVGLKIPEGVRGYYVEVELLATPDQTFNLGLFRTSLASTGSPDEYRVQFFNTGTVRLLKRIGGVQTFLSETFPAPPGSRVGIRWMGGLLSMLVDGTEVASALTNEIPRGGYCALSGVLASTGIRIGSIDTYRM